MIRLNTSVGVSAGFVTGMTQWVFPATDPINTRVVKMVKDERRALTHPSFEGWIGHRRVMDDYYVITRDTDTEKFVVQLWIADQAMAVPQPCVIIRCYRAPSLASLQLDAHLKVEHAFTLPAEALLEAQLDAGQYLARVAHFWLLEGTEPPEHNVLGNFTKAVCRGSFYTPSSFFM